jgi:hypothetical protein
MTVGMATDGVFCGLTGAGAVAMATDGVFCGVVLAEENLGGNQFLVFKPILDPLKEQIQVDQKVAPYFQETETEFVIDGKKYELVTTRSPSEIIKAAPDIERILDEAATKMGITRRKAKKELYKQIIKELQAVETIKKSVFNDDEEIIMILVATDDI